MNACLPSNILSRTFAFISTQFKHNGFQHKSLRLICHIIHRHFNIAETNKWRDYLVRVKPVRTTRQIRKIIAM